MDTKSTQKGRGLNKKKSRRQTRDRNYYGAQFYQTKANKVRKLKSRVKRHPNDKQAARRLKELTATSP